MQGRQAGAAVEFEKVPAAQTEHMEDPLVEKLPGAHEMQLDNPLKAIFPASHDSQIERPTVFPKVPGAHNEQVESPLVPAILPLEQAKQEVNPDEFVTKPAGHGGQLEEADTLE